jgi:hypothetical protein
MAEMQSYYKVVVQFERRSDGGLRAYSDEVPGLVLSHSDPKLVLADIKPALERILSHMFGGEVVVEELPSLREWLTQTEAAPLTHGHREYVTRIAA